jgi:hypothetical protein
MSNSGNETAMEVKLIVTAIFFYEMTRRAVQYSDRARGAFQHAAEDD